MKKAGGNSTVSAGLLFWSAAAPFQAVPYTYPIHTLQNMIKTGIVLLSDPHIKSRISQIYVVRFMDISRNGSEVINNGQLQDNIIKLRVFCARKKAHSLFKKAMVEGIFHRLYCQTKAQRYS